MEHAVLLDVIGEGGGEVGLLLGLERGEEDLRDVEVLLLVAGREDGLGRGGHVRDGTRLRLRAAGASVELRHDRAELAVAILALHLTFVVEVHDAQAVVPDRLLGALHAEQLAVVRAVDDPLEDHRVALHPDAREAELGLREDLEPLGHVLRDGLAAVDLVQAGDRDDGVISVDAREHLGIVAVEALERGAERGLLEIGERGLRRRRRRGGRLSGGRRRRRLDRRGRHHRPRLFSSACTQDGHREERQSAQDQGYATHDAKVP